MSHVATGSTAHDDTPARLAGFIRKRRLELGISARQAAEAAGIARNTWTAAEEGSRRTSETNYAAIERALRWAPGSISRIKTGEGPEPLPTNVPAANSPVNEADEALVRIMRSDLPDAEKARIVRLIIAEQEESRRRMLAMVDELIAETRS